MVGQVWPEFAKADIKERKTQDPEGGLSNPGVFRTNPTCTLEDANLVLGFLGGQVQRETWHLKPEASQKPPRAPEQVQVQGEFRE